jgi:hypothetical protein
MSGHGKSLFRGFLEVAGGSDPLCEVHDPNSGTAGNAAFFHYPGTDSECPGSHNLSQG